MIEAEGHEEIEKTTKDAVAFCLQNGLTRMIGVCGDQAHAIVNAKKAAPAPEVMHQSEPQADYAYLFFKVAVFTSLAAVVVYALAHLPGMIGLIVGDVLNG